MKETLVDVLDLYTHHRMSTLVGPEYPLEAFIDIRIGLNRESSDNKYPRYTEWIEANDIKSTTNGNSNGHISPQSPSRGTVGERGKDGTIRFMLDPARARDEKSCVKEFFEPPREVEETEYVY